MDLYIIRHAQSTNNALDAERERVCDPELSELGRQQAELLARHLAGDAEPEFERGRLAAPNGAGCGITRLFVSPMRRALQTARPVARALGLTPEVWVDLHEHGGVFLDHGPGVGYVGYPGLSRAEMQAVLPGCVLPDGVTERGWWTGAREDRPGCEARAAKVAAALRQWAAATDERMALISHGDFIDALLRALLQAGQACYFVHANTAISRLELRPDGRIWVDYLNRTDHLPQGMIS